MMLESIKCNKPVYLVYADKQLQLSHCHLWQSFWEWSVCKHVQQCTALGVSVWWSSPQ